MWLSADLREIFNMNNVILTLHMIYTTYDILYPPPPPVAITQVVLKTRDAAINRFYY